MTNTPQIFVVLYTCCFLLGFIMFCIAMGKAGFHDTENDLFTSPQRTVGVCFVSALAFFVSAL